MASGMNAADLAPLDDLLRTAVATGEAPGLLCRIATADAILLDTVAGTRNPLTGAPVTAETVWRIHSMTKPVVSVATLMLCEAGHLGLDQPVAEVLPAFAAAEVLLADGTRRPAARPITIRHLLCHTAGLTLPMADDGPHGAAYRAAGLTGSRSPGTLDEIVNRIAAQPLRFDPGAGWQYSMATDVLGRVIEVASRQVLPAFLHDRIFAPLGMQHTGFVVRPEDRDMFAALVEPDPAGGFRMRDDPAASAFLSTPAWASAGGGLVSTADDYLRFARMLLAGGSLDGVTLLAPQTVAEMTRNQLAGDLPAMGCPTFLGQPRDGIGFGLGVQVMLDPSAQSHSGPPGEYGWTGVAGTFWFNNPGLGLIILLFLQVLPPSGAPSRREVRPMVYRLRARGIG